MKDNKPKKLESAAQVLQKLLQNSKNPLSQQFIRWRLWRYWGDVVGSTIASKSLPVGIKGKQLIIWVESSVFLQELLFMRKELVAKVNQYLGQNMISVIRLTTDRKSIPSPEEMPRDLPVDPSS